MAEKKKNPSVGSGILGKNEEKLGTYKESYGGGTPLEAGQKAPSKEWVAANRVMQPRDENGQFTYNSVNKKPLKYGPSRGYTVPPFLKGVKMTYAVDKKSVVIGEDGKRYLAGIEMTAADIVKSYKEYIKDGEEGGFKNLMSEMKKKGGKVSGKEKEAMGKGFVGLFRGLDESFKKEYVKADIREMIKKPVKHFVKKETTATTESPKKETPKPVTEEPKKEVSTTVTSSSDFDSNMAKNSPEEFVEKHSKEIGEIIELVKGTGMDVTASQVVSAIADGSIKSVEHARKLAEETEE